MPINSVCLCHTGRSVKIEELRVERDSLKLRKLKYMKEYELCEKGRKASKENYQRTKSQILQQFSQAETKTTCDPAIITQLALDCWLAFDCPSLPVPSDTINAVPGDGSSSQEDGESPPLLPIARQLTPYPGVVADNKRIEVSQHPISHKTVSTRCSKTRSADLSSKKPKDTVSSTTPKPRNFSKASTLAIRSSSETNGSPESQVRIPSVSTIPALPKIRTQSITPQPSKYPFLTIESLPPPAIPHPNPNSPRSPCCHPDYAKVTLLAHHIAEKEFNPRFSERDLGFWRTLRATYAREREAQEQKVEREGDRQLVVDEILELRKEVKEWEEKCSKVWKIWRKTGVRYEEAFPSIDQEDAGDKPEIDLDGDEGGDGWKILMEVISCRMACVKLGKRKREGGGGS